MARISSKGQCLYCKIETSFNLMPKHLSSCPARLALQSKAKTGAAETLFHLRVQSLNNGAFWLDLEMNGSATLEKLDRYLRAIWLECCGHLSHFAFGGWDGDKLGMKHKINDVFESDDDPLIHLYDYGTTSETMIYMIATRKGKPTTRHPIVLMARNLMPLSKCIVCRKPATNLCQECLIEGDKWGALCDEHIDEHVEENDHNNYGEPIALVNSPRLGMCGYCGDAQPPY